MTGEYQHSLDAKGRLFIPARLREELGSEFYVTISADKCLCAYNIDSWQKFCDKVSAMAYVDQRKMRVFFAYAAKCELDAQGRILVPANLRQFAGLVKNVTVIGANNHAEFWDTEVWDAQRVEQATPENIAAIMMELGF